MMALTFSVVLIIRQAMIVTSVKNLINIHGNLKMTLYSQTNPIRHLNVNPNTFAHKIEDYIHIFQNVKQSEL